MCGALPPTPGEVSAILLGAFCMMAGCQGNQPVRPDGLAREKSNISLPGCQATRCLGTSHMDIWLCGSEVSWQLGIERCSNEVSWQLGSLAAGILRSRPLTPRRWQRMCCCVVAYVFPCVGVLVCGCVVVWVCGGVVVWCVVGYPTRSTAEKVGGLFSVLLLF